MAEATATSREELTRYLDPKVLSRIHRLDLRTRLVVEGFMVGLHRSPYHGSSVEFAQHREYVPGDDTRHIDWKVFSRSDRYYVKQYEEETNLRCTFLVDISESMKYAGSSRDGEGLSKFHYASCVAASLSLLLQQQQDAPGLITFDEDVTDVLPPSANPSQVKAIVHTLDQATARLQRKTSIEHVCHKVVESLGRRGMVCVISDLLVDDDDALMRGLMRLTHLGHDVMVMHILDEEELTFPFEGNTRFMGMEEAGELRGDPRALREGYLEALQRYLDNLRRNCVHQHIGYATLSTADHLGATLAEFLHRRNEMGRLAGSKRRRGGRR